MYRWYYDPQVCYIYLVDVPSDEDPESDGSAFTRSRWFTRGWTFQELLAPPSVIFYDQNWVEIGTKASLQVVISKITGTNVRALLDGEISQSSVGQRMSWASRRLTTRIEDTAYCFNENIRCQYAVVVRRRRKGFFKTTAKRLSNPPMITPSSPGLLIVRSDCEDCWRIVWPSLPNVATLTSPTMPDVSPHML